MEAARREHHERSSRNLPDPSSAEQAQQARDFAAFEAQIERDIANEACQGAFAQTHDEQCLAARPVSQPYQKLSPFDINIRSKGLLEIAKAQEGLIDRTFDKTVTPEYWRYERKINKTSGRPLAKPRSNKSTDQRLRPAVKSPSPPPLPRPKGPSLAELRRYARRVRTDGGRAGVPRSLQGHGSARVRDVQSSVDDGRAGMDCAPIGHSRACVRDAQQLNVDEGCGVVRPDCGADDDAVDLRDRHLEEFLEMADRDPYAGK